MTLLLLEALLALGIGIFIVWWTMFSGRPRERADEAERNHANPPTPTGDADASPRRDHDGGDGGSVAGKDATSAGHNDGAAGGGDGGAGGAGGGS